MNQNKIKLLKKRFLVYALVTLMVLSTYQPLNVSYAVENVNFTISPEYINSDTLPTVVTVTADKSAFTVGSVYPTLIDAQENTQSVSIVDTSATVVKFTVAAGLTDGTYQIRISDPAGDQGTSTKYYTASSSYVIGASTISTSAPFTSLPKGYDEQESITVTGTNTSFSLGQTTVELLQNSSVIDSASVTAVDDGAGATQTITFAVGTGLTNGSYDVRFTSGDDVDTVTGGVVVRDTASIVIDENELTEGYALTNATITGTNTGFDSSTTVKILDSEGVATGKAGTANAVDADTVTFNINTGLSAGTYTVRASTGVEIANATLTVYAPSAEIRKQSDNSALTSIGQYFTSQNLKLIGTNTNFDSGNTSVKVFKDDVEVANAITGTPTVNSSTEILFTLAEWTSTIATGDIEIVAATGDETASATLSVTTPTLSLTYNSDAVESGVIANGYKDFTIDIVGTDTFFSSSSTVLVSYNSEDYAASEVFTDVENLRFTLLDASGDNAKTLSLPAGDYTVTVDLDGDGVETNTVSTTITIGPAADITSVSPNNILRTKSTSKTYTVYGTDTHFEAGTPSVDILGTTSETISNVTAIDATTLTFDLIPSTVDTNGALDLEVSVNSTAISESDTLTGALTASNQGIEASPETYYTLEKGNATITINAEGFTYGTTTPTATLGGTAVTLSNKTSTTIEATLPSSITAGAQSLVLTNDGTDYSTSISVVTSQETSNTPAFKVYGYATNTDANIVVQGNDTLTFNATYAPTIVATRNSVDYSVTFGSISNANNTLTMALPSGLASGYYDIKLTWASGPYSGNTLTLSNYQVKNEVDGIEIYYSGTVSSDRTVYLNGSGTVALSAIGNIVNGSASTEKKSVATWTSSDTAVATISLGTATVVDRGNTTLTVSYDDVQDSIVLYVSGPDSISITGTDSNIRIGESVTLAAVGTYGDATTETLTAKATWSVSNTNASAADNVITGSESGQTTVNAVYGGSTGTLALTVSSIDFTPSTIRTLELGNEVVTIDGIEPGTTITSLTVGGNSVTPTSTSPTITFVTPAGLSAGNVTVEVVAGGKTHSGTLTIVESTMTLSTQLLELGYDAFDMVLTLKNAEVETANKPTVTFNSSAVTSGNVTVDESADTVTFPVPADLTSDTYDVVLSWTSGDYSGNSLTESLTVAGEISYAISGSSTVSVGSTADMTLVATVDEVDQDITSGVTWSSSNTGVATVSTTGTVTAISAGSATITATFQSVEYTKIVVVPSTSTGGGDSDSDGGGGTGTGGTATGGTGTILTPDDTQTVVGDILKNASDLDVKDVVKDLGVLTDSSIVTLKGKDVTLEDAVNLTENVFAITEVLLGREESTASELNEAASSMTQIVGAYVSRDDVTVADAVVWADKVLDQIGNETLNQADQTAQEVTSVATDVIDNVVVKVFEKGLDEATATAVFETFMEDVAKKAIRLDAEKVDSARLMDRIIKASTDIIELAGRVDETKLVQTQVGTETILAVDTNTLLLAANNAIQKSEELRIMVALNTATDIKEQLAPRIGLDLPEVEGDVKLDLDPAAVAGVEGTGAEIQVSAKGTTFVFSNETLKEMKDAGIKLKVGSVGSLEQTIYLKNMSIAMRQNIAKVDNSKQIQVDGYADLVNKPTLSMDFDDTVIFVPEYVNVFVYDESGAEWEFVRSEVDQARSSVSFKPPHFSVYSVVEYSRSFDDVKEHWSRSFVEAMASRGLTSGISETMFGPDYSITRAQFATLLANALGLEGSAGSSFKDVKSGTWYYDTVNLAADAGLVSGMGDGMFEPDAQITREQMAVMIAKAYEIMLGTEMVGRTSTIIDVADVSPWAMDSVIATNYHGVISGYEDGSFKPGEYATRAHGIVMLKKLLDLK